MYGRPVSRSVAMTARQVFQGSVIVLMTAMRPIQQHPTRGIERRQTAATRDEQVAAVSLEGRR
jgi:hypothetical protein